MDGGGYWTVNWAGKPLDDTAAAHLAVLLESSAAMAVTSLDISGLFELVSIRMAFEPFVFAVEAVLTGPDATGPPIFHLSTAAASAAASAVASVVTSAATSPMASVATSAATSAAAFVLTSSAATAASAAASTPV